MKIIFDKFEFLWKFPFFQKKQIVQDIIVHDIPASPAYVYNAGEDFEGTWAHLFGQTNVIQGGVVTRIEEAIEWIQAGRSDIRGRGVVLKQRVQTDPISHRITDQQEGITHLARELAINLEQWSRGQLIVLHCWSGKDVDLSRINTLISGAIEERITKAEALWKRKEEWAVKLREAILPALELEMQRKAKRESELAQNKAYGEFDLDDRTRVTLSTEYREYATDFHSPLFRSDSLIKQGAEALPSGPPDPERLARMKKRLDDVGIDVGKLGSI